MNDSIKRIREITRALGQSLDKLENIDDYIDADCEMQRVLKLEYKQLQKRKDLACIKHLNGKDVGETANYLIEYKTTLRNILDESLIDDIIEDEDTKDLLFVKKPRTIKEIETICVENSINPKALFTKKEGAKKFKFKEK